ncbi:MEDS domain-containing protein [Streptomyces sp. NPDC006529]|uniref:MEDS domain-containing protein n=1 Tax=Streptomyces sp. NPDC006529 TaxID=3157177 RepID=UPI0033BBCFBB
MRAARALATLDEVELGDHVCWFTGSAGFSDDARAYVADGALYGDKIVVVGSSGAAYGVTGRGGSLRPAAVVLDLPQPMDTDVVLAAVRQEARTAAREGFRSVRVLAERAPLTAPGAAGELLAQELGLDAFASESGAMVVCAFQPSQWDVATLDNVASVHPHEMGTRAQRPAFRMYCTGADMWSVDGVIDSECALTFNAAARAVVRGASTVTLRFDHLQMIDAAGMHALVDAARHLPGRRVVVRGANETVRLCWELAGYTAADLPVVMAA